MPQDNSPSMKHKELQGHTQLELVEQMIKHLRAIEDETTVDDVRGYARRAYAPLCNLRETIKIAHRPPLY